MQESGKRFLDGGSYQAKERGITGETDAEFWEFMVMHCMRLGGQDALRFAFRDTGRERFMRDGNVFRDVRDHFNALLDVLVQKIGAQLRIQNTARQKNERHSQQDGDEGDEQIGYDQAVAQTPQQAASPPANQREQKINACENREIFQEAEKAAVKPKDSGHQSNGCHCGGNEVWPREAAPNFFEVSAERCHRAINGNNTLPEEASPAEENHEGGIRAGRQAPGPSRTTLCHCARGCVSRYT